MKKAKHSIVILDDEEATLFAFKEALSDHCLSIDTAQSLDEVKHLLYHKQYHGAVLDLRLNSGSEAYEGFKAITMVKLHNPQCKIIVLTAYGHPDLKEKALRMKADIFLEKPASPENIKNIFKSLGALQCKPEDILASP